MSAQQELIRDLVISEVTAVNGGYATEEAAYIAIGPRLNPGDYVGSFGDGSGWFKVTNGGGGPWYIWEGIYNFSHHIYTVGLS